jgi:hypothetical protein
MTTLNDIQRYYDVINSSLFMTTGKLDYERITDAIIALANAVHSYDPDDKFELYEVWDIGEGGESTVSELIVGAYWHYSEWHAGQWSKGYAALCDWLRARVTGVLFGNYAPYPLEVTRHEQYRKTDNGS